MTRYAATWNAALNSAEMGIPLQCPSLYPQYQDQEFLNQTRTRGRLHAFKAGPIDLGPEIVRMLKDAIASNFPDQGGGDRSHHLALSEFVVNRARKRILRSLEKRGLIAFTAAPGDDEGNAVLGEGFGEYDPAHSTLLHAATSGSPPAGPPERAQPEPAASDPLELEWSGQGESADGPDLPSRGKPYRRG